jgi:hypothetical protein
MDTMPAKKKARDVRGTHLGIRLTGKERKRLSDVARRFPGLPESYIAREALLRGLALVEAEGLSFGTPAADD